MTKCKDKEEEKKASLSFEKNPTNLGVAGEKKNTISNLRFDQYTIKQALACMIILDELFFSFVEGEGFKKFMATVYPQFCTPSRFTITMDYFNVYITEKTKLKDYFRLNNQRVCLTIDTWTYL
jgi:hypothetical protein